MLSLTCTVFYCRHHPWVSRLHAGLKGWNLIHRSNCWSGNSPATLFLFSLPPEQCCSYELSHNNLCWDCRLYIVWTAGGNGLCFLFKNYFLLQQQLEAKSELLLVSTCVVAGAGFLCDVPSKRWQWLVNQPVPTAWPQGYEGGGSHHVQEWHVTRDKTVSVDSKAAFTPNLFGAVQTDYWFLPTSSSGELWCALLVVLMQSRPTTEPRDSKCMTVASFQKRNC